ncbi:hypothetical protein SHELI_v1c04440 [Spiroplasma helicoides]|uniref:Uncharacterized protein n=1 Tax=Spiroplasma helicoides TaxID=216938 RepID=A0A1B3SKD5_9MOLU|nr:hypothetical protein [Spiroplasma helicoides]AOG60395.1 hypothetical protein SHELI_v1c04440 [Spiroplasma helicoides]
MSNEYNKKIISLSSDLIDNSGIFGVKGYNFQKIYLIYFLLIKKNYDITAFYEQGEDITFLESKNNNPINMLLCQVKSKFTKSNSVALNTFKNSIETLIKKIEYFDKKNSHIYTCGRLVFSGIINYNRKPIKNLTSYGMIINNNNYNFLYKIENKLFIEWLNIEQSQQIILISNQLKKIYKNELDNDRLIKIIRILLGSIDEVVDKINVESKNSDILNDQKGLKYSNIIDAVEDTLFLDKSSKKFIENLFDDVLNDLNLKSIEKEIFYNYSSLESKYKWGVFNLYDEMKNDINDKKIKGRAQLKGYLEEKLENNKEENTALDLAYLYIEGIILMEDRNE